MKKLLLLSLLLCPPAAGLRAAQLPDLHDQAAWGPAEKKEFLQFLGSGRGMPAGNVRGVAYSAPAEAARKARYAALDVFWEQVTVDAGGGKISGEPSTLGAKLALGAHLFSWVRYYAGLKYSGVGQRELDGSTERLSHLEVPAGLELALIPLGTPHTRYVLLRGGLSEHYFYGPGKKSDFAAPLLGWHPAWNLGAGYEWQFYDSCWRFHALAEYYRSFGGDSVQFHGAGLTAGFVYTY